MERPFDLSRFLEGLIEFPCLGQGIIEKSFGDSICLQ